MRTKTHRIWIGCILAALLITGLGLSPPAQASGRHHSRGKIVVADRASCLAAVPRRSGRSTPERTPDPFFIEFFLIDK